MTEHKIDDRVLVSGVVVEAADGQRPSVRIPGVSGALLVVDPAHLRPDTGRPITAADVQRAYGYGLDRVGVADYLNRIARGEDEPRTEQASDELIQTLCDELGVERGELVDTVNQNRVIVMAFDECVREEVARRTAGSLPAMPPEVREALGWLRKYPLLEQLLRDGVAGPETRDHAATLVRWLISVTDEVTGDSAERDGNVLRKGIRRALGIDDDVQVDDDGLIADVQDRVRWARWCHDEHQIAKGDPSPRSWSLPAPPPDDVTVVHVGGVRFDRDLDMWRDSVNGEALRWGELLDTGTVVEGEPQAADDDDPLCEDCVAHRTGEPQAAGWRGFDDGYDGPHDPMPQEPPRFAVGDRVRVKSTGKVGTVTGRQGAFVHARLDDHPDIKFLSYDADKLELVPEPRFERGFYRLADMFLGGWSLPEHVEIVVDITEDGDVWFAVVGESLTGLTSHAALAAAGAVRVGNNKEGS